MICPHCLKTIDDDASFCPFCHGYVGAGSPAGSDFVFCEGCGARLSPQDRVCPKCGRPAPGILSTASASSDLAAGKTASFPRLTKQMIESSARERQADLRHEALTASQVAVDSVDPFATNVLDASDIEEAMRAVKAPVSKKAAPAPVESGADPYHKPEHRGIKRAAIALAAVGIVAGGAYFVYRDPLGLMPELRARVEQSASQMFPSRQRAAGSASVDVRAVAQAEADRAKSTDAVLTEDQAYQRLTAAYKTIVQQHDALGDVIDDYNASYIASDLDERKQAANTAYASRDALDAVISDLQGIKLQDGSAYAQEVQDLVQLAQWVRTRVDVYCSSWDVSLSYTGSDLPSSHESKILAPLRERAEEDAQARDSYFAHVDAYKPASPQ